MPEIAKAGGKLFTFHYEATCECLSVARGFDDVSSSLPRHHSPAADPQSIIDLIHSHGLLAGLAISPPTPANAITPSLAASADLLLVMTVHPGKGGQKFMPECLDKVRDLRTKYGDKVDIQVDGGVGGGNICDCANAGESV